MLKSFLLLPLFAALAVTLSKRSVVRNIPLAVAALAFAASFTILNPTPRPAYADHNGLHATPCDDPSTVGGGASGNSAGPVGPPNSLGWDVGGGQCNGSFTVTTDSAFPSDGGGGIELGIRTEQRRVGQVRRIAGNDYLVETGNDTNVPPAVNRAYWNFQHSIAYDGDIDDLDSLIFSIRTDAGPNLPVQAGFDMLALRGIIDDRNNQPNATATYSDLYQTSQNPEFGWFAPTSDTDANPTGAFDYDQEGAWLMTLTAEKDGQVASVSMCVHTPNARCLPDHFSCYEAKGNSVNETVTLDDQFGFLEFVNVRKPKLFCNPVDKNGEGIGDEESHLTCYNVRVKNDNFKATITVDNQFGEQVLEVNETKLLCVPSKKLDVQIDDDSDSDSDSDSD